VQLSADCMILQHPRSSIEEKADILRQAAAAGSTALATVDIVTDGAFTGALQAVAVMLAEPGPFLAYTHGDPCPENCCASGTTLRLIDFEFGGFRHAPLDGVGWQMAFPTSPNSQRLPSWLVDRREMVYRRALMVGCPEAADEASFQEAVLPGSVEGSLLGPEPLRGSPLPPSCTVRSLTLPCGSPMKSSGAGLRRPMEYRCVPPSYKTERATARAPSVVQPWRR
jgi:hypothetical protein